MFFTQLGVMALSAMMAFSSPQSDAEPYTEEPQPAIVTEAYEYPVTPKDPEWPGSRHAGFRRRCWRV